MKCAKNEVRSSAARLKMLQNHGLEGCCAAPGGLLGHLGVGGASGEASYARLGGVLEPSWGRFGASMGSSWGCFEVSGALPGVILLPWSAI